jgi:uncharacterized protein YggE
MKKLIILAAFMMIGVGAFAQSVDLRRKIEVTGTAEQEVTPDIIHVFISLQEYLNGKNKVTIDQLERQLEDAVKDAGIAKEDFTINNLSAWNYTWQKKKNPDFLASKQYGIKFRDLNKFNQILSKIDYTKIDQLKNDLKLKALLNARDKATFLLSGIGEKLGGAINIVENDNSSFPQPRPVMYMAKSMASADAMPAESDINFKSIKLSFQVQAVFEIK